MTEAQSFRITKVEKQKRNTNRFNVYINDNFAFSAHEDILIKYNLWKDRVLQTNEYEQVIAEDEQHRVYLDAIRYLSRRRHSAKELKDKLLAKGYEAKVCDVILIKLREQSFINDSEFAHSLTEQRIFSQRKGKLWIKQELQHKGVDKQQIEHALNHVSSEDERGAALQLAQKKWGNFYGDKSELLEKKRKVMGFLMRRGFSRGLVNDVLQEVTGQMNDDWEDS